MCWLDEFLEVTDSSHLKALRNRLQSWFSALLSLKRMLATNELTSMNGT